jgi:P pilus assembly chaperone PapD
LNQNTQLLHEVKDKFLILAQIILVMKRALVKSISTLLLSLTLLTTLCGQDIEVSPVKLNFSAEPGENQTKIVNVKNNGGKKISMLVSMADFILSENGDKKMLAPNTTKHSCANWLSINPSFFDLNPGEEKAINVTILVPTTEYSSAWCTIYIQPVQEQTAYTPEKKLSTGLTLTSKVAVFVYQTPPSNTNQLVKVYNLKAIPSTSDSTLRFSTILDNLGERINSCKVYAIISDIKTAEEKQYPPMMIEIFPKSTREVILEIPNNLKPGQYALAVVVDYGSKSSLEGAQITLDIK